MVNLEKIIFSIKIQKNLPKIFTDISIEAKKSNISQACRHLIDLTL